MNGAGKMVAVLDANVLYPAPMRDLLLSLAAEGLYQPKWSAEIQWEWVSNLLNNRPDLTRKRLFRTVNAMENAFPDAKIFRYQMLIPGLLLPDPDDRHVLATAIRGRAEIIVTQNLKDFPASVLAEFDIETIHPDQFSSEFFQLYPETAMSAFRKMVRRLKNPPQTAEQVVETLRRNGLGKTATLISKEI